MFDDYEAKRAANYVYVVFDLNLSYSKIGFTNRFEHRIAELSREAGFVVCPVLLLRAGRSFERLLHHQYHRKQVRSEWFTLGNDDIKEILMICTERGVDVAFHWPITLPEEPPQIPKSYWDWYYTGRPRGVDALMLDDEPQPAAPSPSGAGFYALSS